MNDLPLPREIRLINGRTVSLYAFPEALQAVTSGYKITKAEWGDDEYYCVLHDGLLMLHKPDGFHTWIISEGDLAGTDWQVFD